MSPIFVISGVRTLAPCELSPCGPLLDKKYFLTEWRCRREDRAQKGIRMNFFLRSAAFRGHTQLTRGHPLGTAAAPKVPPGAKFDGVDGGTPPPWRGPVCTYGRAGTDAVRTRAREKRETKRTTDLQLLLPIARGAFCFAFLARTWPCAIAVGGLLGGARFQVLHQKYLVVGKKVSRTAT